MGCDNGAIIEYIGQPLSWTPLQLVGHQIVMQMADNVTTHVQQLIMISILQIQCSEDMYVVTIESHSDILSLVTYVVKSVLSSCSPYDV